MAESSEADERETATGTPADGAGAGGASPRVDPGAAVVTPHVPVPPDAHDPEELPTRLRPLSAIRAAGARLRDLVAGTRRRGRSGRGN
ncbi:hypothetical protein BRC97_00625 [Halobacteriales archaeon QS_6_71_20]|nr:MAG: hypothetical protein BRC97_00625 [Halobacteriales archaeon QS_6_71_20]